MHTPKILFLAVASVALIGGCKKNEPSNEAAMPAAAAPAAAAPTIEPAAPAPAPAPTAANTVIASQSGIAGSTWDLTRAQVTGNILTLQFTVTPQADKSLFEYSRIKVEQIALIDDTTAQRYSVLKDDTGRPMVSPIEDGGDTLKIGIGANSTGVVWLKFPAPPATSQTVSITIPEVGPFDGIKVSR